MGAKPVDFSMEQNLKLYPDTRQSLDDLGACRCLIRQLIYLTITRPEITYAMNMLSQFMHSPRQPHMDIVTRVLCYLKSCPGKGIIMPSRNSLQFGAYCDSDWASCPTTRRFIMGYCTFLGNSPIS